MSKIENIINKIIDDAKIEAEKTIYEAEEQNKKKLVEWEEKKNKEEKFLMTKAHEKAEENKNRILADSKIELRDKIIVEKHSIINKIINEVKDELIKIDDNQYLSILNEKLELFSDIKDDIEIIVPIGKKELLEKSNLEYKFDESANIASGFIIKKDKIFYNNDFNELIENKREKIIVEISQIIFD